jgi:hemerythrin-like metal-binding protein
MGFIEWTPALDLGIVEIDGQHRRLVGLINALSDAAASGRGRGELGSLIAELEAYAVAHFGLEESLFAKYSYPAAAAHQAEHAAFVARVAAFKAAFAAGEARLDGEVLAFLKSWLVSHISFSDRKYRSLLKERGHS